MNTYRQRWIKDIATTVSIVAIMGLTALAAVAKDDNHIVLKPGTVIPVTLNNELSSRTANVGDTFTATVDTSRGAYGRIMQGATVTGYVKSVDRQSGDQPGMIDVAFTRLDLADGTNYTIDGEPASLDSKYVSTDRDGMLVAKSTSSHRGLKFAGIGAGAGRACRSLGNRRSQFDGHGCWSRRRLRSEYPSTRLQIPEKSTTSTCSLELKWVWCSATR